MPNLFLCSLARGLAICLILFINSTATSSYAQQQEYLPFHPQDTLQLHQMAQMHRASIQNHFTIPAKASARYRKDLETIIERSSENAYYMVRKGAFPHPVIEPYVQAVFQNIISANQELRAAKLILSRSPVENAYALADGTVFLNIGLLANLENESQIAYILCHELAHIKLNHMERSVREYLDALHSKDFKKQYIQAARSKYNRNAKMGEVLEGLSLSNLFHSRSQESQADSLGFFMMSRTGYDLREADAALQVLERVDSLNTARKLDLTKFFNGPELDVASFLKPKKSASIFDEAIQDSSLYAHADTLRTHPDAAKRRKYLDKLWKSTSLSFQDHSSQGFPGIRAISQLELVQSWFDSKNYDYALFNALLLLEQNPESEYLRSMVILCLYELKQYLLQHRFAEIMAVESDAHSESFNQLIRLLNNMNTSDYKALANCFANTGKQLQQSHEHASAARYALAALQEDTAGAAAAKAAYLKHHAQGRFREMLFPTVSHY